MPKVTYLKEFEGALWARLELDQAPSDGAVHVFTDAELRGLKDTERQAVRREIENALDRWSE